MTPKAFLPYPTDDLPHGLHSLSCGCVLGVESQGLRFHDYCTAFVDIMVALATEIRGADRFHVVLRLRNRLLEHMILGSEP